MIPFTDQRLMLDALDDPSAALREDIDPQKLGELADDMGNNGLLQPIGARGPSPKGRYEIIWGHRRTLAARMLKWTEIPARVCEWHTTPELARLAENFHRVDLNPREEARAVAALLAAGKPVAEIARILRRSLGWIQTRRELLEWPTDLQERVARGELSLQSARLLSEIDHDSYRANLIDETIRTGASANVISVWLAHYVADRDRIIRNAETVEQIVGRREVFRVMTTCQCCRQEIDSTRTVLLRICGHCAQQLDEQQQLEDAEARTNGRRARPD